MTLQFTGFVLCVATLSVHAVPTSVLNPDVTSATQNQTICVSGYSKMVRPSTSFTRAIKKRLLLANGLDYKIDKANYEFDHIIPLALGGHPRNPQNLVLQDWEGEVGAKRKDRLEAKLHCLVCNGRLDLEIAQEVIWTDWMSAHINYRAMVCHHSHKRQLNSRYIE